PRAVRERFEVLLDANGSDVRLMELSLQPTSLTRSAGTTTYTWDYSRLLLGQPVRLDVLGIAPIDRLGELTWLSPISVITFGLLVGLVVHAFAVTRFDRWMLLLTVGTFAGAYPLMYFAQEYIPLEAAVLGAAGVALLIIGGRAGTLMGWRLALAGVLAPAAGRPAGAIVARTLGGGAVPRGRGSLRRVEGLIFFTGARMLSPRLRFPEGNGAAAAAPPAEAAPGPAV